MTATAWNAGARSVEGLSGDGRFSFCVPAWVGAVSVGLVAADNSTDPQEHRYGFYFSEGRYHAILKGVMGEGVAFTGAPVFSIIRYQDGIYLCVGESKKTSYVGGLPFHVPGAVVAMDGLSYRGTLYLDASLAVPGDLIQDASMHGLTASEGACGASIAFRRMDVIGRNGELSAGSVTMPMRVRGLSGDTRGSVVFDPMVAASTQGGVNHIQARFTPMTAMGGEGRPAWLNGAEILMMPDVRARASRAQHAVLDMPLVAMGSQVASAQVVMSFAPMSVRSTARGSPSLLMYVALPPLSAPSRKVSAEDVTDGAIGGESSWPASYTLVGEVIVASDAAFSGAIGTEDVSDAARGVVKVRLGASVAVESVAVVREEVFLGGHVLLVATATAGDAQEFTSTGGVLVAGSALASDAVLATTSVDLPTVALASDQVALGGSTVITDAVVAGEELVADSLVAGALLTDVALASEATFLQVVGRGLLEDVAIAGDEPFVRNTQAVAWVMNTSTGAVSWYDNWPFTSMVEVGGKVFAAGPEGLHVLGGDKDGADLINASVQYGFNEFGGYDREGSPKENPQRKRVQALWFGYHADGVLNATVETYGQGYGPFTYEMPPREAHQPRNNRIIPGRGLNSRYWRIGIANTNGCAFEVHSVAADVAESTRRI